MSHHTWNFNHQKQEQQVVEKEEEENRYPRGHVHNQQNQNQVDPNPMSNKCEVAELTWENGQVAMHRLGSNLPNEQTEHTWGKAGDTLESIVHQATFQKQNHSNLMGSDGQNQANINRDKNASYGCQQKRGVLKRMRSSDSDPQLYGGGITVELSARASAKDNDIPMVTWPCNEDSACHGGSENKEEERETKSSNLSKRSRRAAVHNQSERRRRDRINEKMKALQKLVPNASKTDKASMLEEVIKYLKQLQAQVQLISNARNMEQQMMMMSLGMQSHIQMPLLARMGMCSTAGMLNNMTANLARAPYLSSLIYPTSSSIPTLCPPFMSPDFAVASSIPTPSQPNRDSISPTITKSAAAPNIATTSSFPFNHPYNAFLPQSMKMEFNNEMAAQYLQQANQENVNIQGQKE